ncbi:Wadjet anti-phage system protein JetD domain-containing protein [Pseudoflavitalea rhizosphaerae]|uniref:Wadjet anti-phage system protein JetD domain-containing protein n=1 Tax=Pseudoflavitalea rhizosphaerae TaxID=1884793 RepID=UPI000F8C3145|nr:Wadjet anti-phage system protein JetD domain-containing protein [Pseudoflavitalea rhizosphaerae]
MKKGNPFLNQLEKKYAVYLGSLITGEHFFPVRLRGLTKPANTVQLHNATKDFVEFEKKETRPGWAIEWETWSSKKLGVQKWPANITIEAEEDYLYILDKVAEIQKYKMLVQQLLNWQPVLRPWLANKPQRVLELSEQWQHLMAVIDYVKDHDLSEFYLRSIPVPVHTKFIKQYESILLSLLKQIAPERFPVEVNDIGRALGVKAKPVLYPIRWLDPGMAVRYTAGIVTLAVSSEDLKKMDPEISEVWLVENETNLFLLQNRQNAVGLVSKGNALHVLSDVPFFKKARLLYWGDLDEAGFRMLHQFRQLYPALESILMDEETLKYHQQGMRIIDTRNIKMELKLKETELTAFGHLRETKGRIEQEQLDQAFVQQYLSAKGLGA